jgi:acyl carrier protein
MEQLMDSNALLAELQPIFRDILDQPDLVLTRGSNSQNVEDWDSLAHINLVTSIEKKFKIKFALSELQGLKNVGEMIDLMLVKMAGR